MKEEAVNKDRLAGICHQKLTPKSSCNSCGHTGAHVSRNISITVLAGAIMPLFQPEFLYTSAFENDLSD